MRTDLNTIQQTLTPEAASVLNQSVAEATRRNHGQTTPLHVAATLLYSPSAFLKQTCIKSNPNSSHPLQCRALELCFNVALERLPQNACHGHDPPISNALMAALKRAQAHQRKGCPEQQQQPLLAVKVEIEQLTISMLDDPSVSRVMREAGFSSPDVKARIEQSLSLNSSSSSTSTGSSGLGFRTPATTNRNLYVNPRLQQGSVAQSWQKGNEEVKRVLDVLLKNKKRNPVLVGESESEILLKQLLQRIENEKTGDGSLQNVHVIHLEKDFVDNALTSAKIAELGGLIETKIQNLECEGVIINIGDLKWLVEQPTSFPGTDGGVLLKHQRQITSEAGSLAVEEMAKLLARFRNGSKRVWLIGTASCETYLRCQVYHPYMENDWDLQAVPIAPKAHLPGIFFRLGKDGKLSNSSPMNVFPTITPSPPLGHLHENLDLVQRTSCCQQCMKNYEQELAKISPREESDRFSSELTSEPTLPLLPRWLKIAKSQGDAKTLDEKPIKDQASILKQKSEELQKKWHDTCLRLHSGYNQPIAGSGRIIKPALSMTSLYNPKLLARQPFQPKLSLDGTPKVNPQIKSTIGGTRQEVPSQSSGQTTSAPGSPVRTDLVLGRPKSKGDIPGKEFLTFPASATQSKLQDALDVDLFKRLVKGLLEKVWWQREAASAVATTVTRCKLGNGKQRGNSTKGDIWLLFSGPDMVGKKKMAFALSDLVYGTDPITVSLSSRHDYSQSKVNFRGKTVLDRIVEAVKRNPFSVIMLEDIDEADMIVRGSIKRAMEKGRFSDSHGREINLGNVIFILTANWLPDSLKFLQDGGSLDEEKLANLASGGWQLRLSLCEKTAKRRRSWLQDGEKPAKPRKDSGFALSFDLNMAADTGDDQPDDSPNPNEITTELILGRRLPRELLEFVDDNIIFKSVDLASLGCEILDFITKKFYTIISEGFSFQIQDEALQTIAGGLWLSRGKSLTEWTEKTLIPSIRQLRLELPRIGEESTVAQLELDDDSTSRSEEDWLPSSVRLVVDGLR